MSGPAEIVEPAAGGRSARAALRRLIPYVGLAVVIAMPGGHEVVAPVIGPAAAADLPHAVLPEDGQGRRRHLHLAPVVKGGRFTSGFGMRQNPMGGGGARHEGVDIAAPAGTAVRASASGRIVELGWRGSYGRFIRIRHADGLETAYAHLSRFADGLDVGRRVKQDEVIGRVGSSGSVTAPHLHFEVRRHGKPVNPLALPQARSRR